jgi:glycosyltransferase involved in cell wall biosynthesis
VDSILSQDYTNFELILVDDGSTDTSPALCDAYAEKDTRVIVIHKQNARVAAARNDGLDRASGDYITFIDSDDWISQDMFSRLVRALEKDSSDIATISSAVIVTENNEPVPKFTLDTVINLEGKYPSRELEKQFLETEPLLTTVVWGKLYRKNIFKDLRFITGRPYEDTLIMPHVYERAKTVSVIKGDFYYYLQRSTSTMHKKYSHKDACDFVDSRIAKVVYYYRHGFTDASYDYERHQIEMNLLRQVLTLSSLPEDEREHHTGEYNKRRDWFNAQKWYIHKLKTRLELVREEL